MYMLRVFPPSEGLPLVVGFPFPPVVDRLP